VAGVRRWMLIGGLICLLMLGLIALINGGHGSPFGPDLHWSRCEGGVVAWLPRVSLPLLLCKLL
jgi:hypothetical protein